MVAQAPALMYSSVPERDPVADVPVEPQATIFPPVATCTSYTLYVVG